MKTPSPTVNTLFFEICQQWDIVPLGEKVLPGSGVGDIGSNSVDSRRFINYLTVRATSK